MPRLFSRIISFKVEGEIYDNKTSPEQVINDYNFNTRHFNDREDRLFIDLHNKNGRGRITKIQKLPKIGKIKGPDSRNFVVM